jgi:hypothetical protein
MRYALAIGFSIWFLVAAVYVFLMFVDHTPERMRTWTTNRPIGYWTTWKEPPLYGLFGFPHQAGWRDVMPLVQESDLPYASNEEEEITNWYMKQTSRTHCSDFDSFILAENVQDKIPYDANHLTDFSASYKVEVNGRSTLTIYTSGKNTVMSISADQGKPFWVTPREAVPPVYAGVLPVGVVLGNDQVRLLGYDINLEEAYPGGSVVVVLYWQAIKPFEQNYQAFVHLYDEALMAQHDGPPECNIMPTTRWEPGQIIVDPHVVALPSETIPGELQIMAGLYNLTTQERLLSTSGEDLIQLQSLQIREALE